MKIKLEKVKEFLVNTKIGDVICVYQANGTMHCGASPYYRRIGIYNGVKKNKYGTDCISVLIGEKKKNYMIRMNLEDDFRNCPPELLGYCAEIKGIERV